MATKKTLSDLKEVVAENKAAEATGTEQPVKAEDKKPVLDEKGRAYGTGRRKDAVARVWVQRGNGKIVINGREQEQYFARGTQRLVINQPFEITNRTGQFDVVCLVSGGGLSGQAGAVRHGISRALINFEPALRLTLKKSGLLTRDSRMVERKKYGKHKARRSTQWVKR